MTPTVLVIAGSDSSGGAGVDADRDALAELGVAGEFVVTAWTEQDARGVRALNAVEPARWREEALGLARAAGVDLGALKFGLLPGAAAVRAAAELVRALAAERGALPPIVLDPVLASSSGHAFLDDAARAQLVAELGPLDLVWTPNLPEAAALTGRAAAALEALDARTEAARALCAAGARAVVLKGGHGGEDPVRDLVLERGAAPVALEHPRVAGASIRGSGCRFASALAGELARGASVVDAARAAGALVLARLRRARS